MTQFFFTGPSPLWLSRLSLSQKVILGFSIPIGLIILLAYAVHSSTQTLVSTNRWVEHTHKVIAQGHLLEKLLLEMETGERGFLITGKDNFLAPFNKAKDEWVSEIEYTKNLVSDNPLQVENLYRINLLAEQWVQEAAIPEIAERRKVHADRLSIDHIETILEKKVGKNILDDIRSTAAELSALLVAANNQEAMRLLTIILKDVVDQETGERGFLITGDDEFLGPYYDGIKNFTRHLSELRSLIMNAPDKQEVTRIIADIETLSQTWLTDAAKPEIALRQQQNSSAQALSDSIAAESRHMLLNKAQATERLKAAQTPANDLSAQADALMQQEQLRYDEIIQRAAITAEQALILQLEDIVSQERGKSILDDMRQYFTDLRLIFEKSNDEYAHTLVVKLAKAMVDQETGQRGYLLTGQTPFLAPFESGQIAFAQHLAALKGFASNILDKENAMERINTIENLNNQWHSLAAEVEIQARRQISQTGLSPLEKVQQAIDSDALTNITLANRKLIATLVTLLTDNRLIEGVNTLSLLETTLSDQRIDFIQYMINGQQRYLDDLNAKIEQSQSLFIELAIIIDKHLSRDALATAQMTLQQLLNNVNQWQRSHLEGSLQNNRSAIISRASALSQIQKVLKKGKGKQLLDEARVFIQDIDSDFVRAKNLRASHLTHSIAKHLVDQETGERGFIITGDESFLEPYYSGSSKLNLNIAELKSIADESFDIKESTQLLRRIETLVEKWQRDSARPEIELRHQVNAGNVNFSLITETLSQGLGKSILDDIRYQQKLLNQKFRRAQNQHAQRLIADIGKDIVDMETGQRGFLLSGKPSFLQPYHQGIDRIAEHFNALYQLISQSYDADTMRQKIENLRLKAEQWKAEAAEPEIALRRELSESGATMSDVTRLIENETGKTLIEKIQQSLANFIQIEQDLIKIRSKESQDAAERTLYQTIFGALFATILAFVSGFYLLRTILQPIEELNNGTRKVASGDFDQVLTIHSKDEIGHLAEAFNTMTRRLKTSTEDMEASTAALEKQAIALSEKNKQVEISNADLIAVQAELKQKAHDLEQSSQYKSDFLATMSHEIRTPMNGVLGMLGLLVKTELDDDQRRKANMAHASANSLLTIINDILDFSKIDSGKLDLEVIDFNLLTLFEDVSESIALRAEEKGLELILNTVNIRHPMTQGDPGRVRQILTNLIGNALKFTESGEIVIRAATQDKGNGVLQLTCDIEDTGIGISKAHQHRLFNAFSQEDASTTRKYGGTGLGLSIVKTLCHLMQGNIKVNSTQGKGSCFTFTIDLGTSQQSAAVKPLIDISTLRILIVDDNATNREVLREQLATWGAQVTEASSAEHALSLCQKMAEAMPSGTPKTPAPFDIALLDFQMPDVNGAELGRRLKKHPVFSQIHLVMMSSITTRGDAQYFADIGFSGYFPKPVTTSDLHDTLSVLGAGANLVSDAQPLVTKHYLHSLEEEKTEQPSITWLPNTRILLVEDNSINQQVAQELLEDLDLIVDVAGNGIEALQTLRQAQQHDHFALVLMDCQMPELDGYETTQNIRKGSAGHQYQHIPIIAMTANAMMGDREKCLDCGMNDYLSKPIDNEELHRVMHRWLSPAESSPPPSETRLQCAPNDAVWNEQAALKYVNNKPERLKRLVDLFIDDMPNQLKQLQRAVKEADFDGALHIAHSIKGVVGTLGASSLHTLAERAEQAARDKDKDILAALLPALDSSHQQLTDILTRYVSKKDVSKRDAG